MGLSADATGGPAVAVVPEPAGVVDDVDVHAASTTTAHVVRKVILAMLHMATSSHGDSILIGA
jgi:hypothetical protein